MHCMDQTRTKREKVYKEKRGTSRKSVKQRDDCAWQRNGTDRVIVWALHRRVDRTGSGNAESGQSVVRPADMAADGSPSYLSFISNQKEKSPYSRPDPREIGKNEKPTRKIKSKAQIQPMQNLFVS